MRFVCVAYVLMVCIVVGWNLPVVQSPEEQCLDYVHHLLSQVRPGPSGRAMIPHPTTTYDVCVARMKANAHD